MKNSRRAALLASFVLMSGAMHGLCARTSRAIDAGEGADANGRSIHSASTRLPTTMPRGTVIGASTGDTDTWSRLGPEGADVVDVAVSPIDATIVLAAVAPSVVHPVSFNRPHAGMYRSTDSGEHWAPVPGFDGNCSETGVRVAFLEAGVRVAFPHDGDA